MNLITHVRNEDGYYIGTVAAVGRGQVGWTKCNRKKDNFDRKFGARIAIARASSEKARQDLAAYLAHLGNPLAINTLAPDLNLNEEMISAIKKMFARAEKYYKADYVLQ